MNSFETSQELQGNYYGKDLVVKSNWYSSVAEAYDRVRPRYSKELIDFVIDRAQLSPQANILEIGCGPAIATTSFASYGFRLVGLEPSLAAYQLAQKNCLNYPNVELQQTTFEEWLIPNLKFDAVLAATSIHWISPEIGYPKIAQVLKNQGALILLWNTGLQASAEINQSLLPIYQTYAPSLKPFKSQKQEKNELQAIGQKIINSGYFHHLASQELIMKVTYSIADYLLLLSTYSPYIALTIEARQNLFTEIKNCLQKICGEQIMLSYLSIAQVLPTNP